MDHKPDSFITVFSPVISGQGKREEIKQECNVPFSSFLVKFFIDIVPKILLSSREL